MFYPRKSKPFSTCVIKVFSEERTGQEGFDQRLDRHSQQLLGVAGNDEVIRIANQMHLRCPTTVGAFSVYRENFPEPAFEAVERDV